LKKSVLPSKRIWPWLLASLLIASGSCFGPRLYPYDPILRVSYFLSGLWVVILIVAIFREKKQGLWLLVGAPLASFIPIVLYLWDRACRENIKACP